MTASLRSGTIVALLVGCVALVAALGHRVMSESADALAADETTGSVTPRAALPLSDEQRARIFDSVMRLPDAPVAAAPAPDVADRVPREVPLQDLPAGVAHEIPLVQGHKFAKFDDRIVLVDPATRRVVAMMPRYKLLLQ
jgi:Protein of unknown function (DUF1236)